MTSPSLLRSVLQSGVDSVAECVRKLHYDGARIRVAGEVEVQPARNMLARFLCAIGGIPRVSGPVEAELVIAGTPTLERWCRSIGPWRLPSLHTAEDGTLIERVRGFDLRFALSVEEHGIRYTQTAAYVRLLGMRIRLPRFVAPRVEAFERPHADGLSAVIGVTLSAPLIGLLVRYGGTVRGSPA